MIVIMILIPCIRLLSQANAILCEDVSLFVVWYFYSDRFLLRSHIKYSRFISPTATTKLFFFLESVLSFRSNELYPMHTHTIRLPLAGYPQRILK